MSTPVWPFPVKDWSQFRRDDEGVDLQYPGSNPVAILAVAPGTLQTAGPDPNGFGIAYPLLELDHPVDGFTAIYYGHTFPDWSKVGDHVKAGEVIGQTGGAHSGGNAYGLSNWLEIGFWTPAYGNGQIMHAYLDGAAMPPPGAGAGSYSQIDFTGADTRDSRAIAAATHLMALSARQLVGVRMQMRPMFLPRWRP